jgi:hypothetical protein
VRPYLSRAATIEQERSTAMISSERVPGAHGGTHGVALHCADVPGFRLTETRHRPGLTLRAHAHERACVVCVLDGAFVESLAAGATTARAETCCYAPRERCTRIDSTHPTARTA